MSSRILRNCLRFCAGPLTLLLLAGAARGSEETGSAAYPFLNLGASARLEAMAGVGVSFATPTDALAFNPARLTGARAATVAASWYSWLPDVQGGWISAALPAGSAGAWGVSLRSLRVADFGNLPGESEIGQSDLALAAGWARRMAGFDGGLALRWVQSSVADEKLNGWSADAGASWVWTDGWELGAAARNLGPAVGYDDNAQDQLPTSSAFGLQARFGELRWGSDVSWENGAGWTGAVGGEYLWRERLALRSGVRLGGDQDDAFSPWTAGLGVRVRDGLDLDYAFHDGILDPSHRIGLRWRAANPVTESALARSPREFYTDVVRQALGRGLRDHPQPLDKGKITVLPSVEHLATDLVSELIAEQLREEGYVVAIQKAKADAAAEDNAKGATTDKPDGVGEIPTLMYEVVASDYAIVKRSRHRKVGPETVVRRATVDFTFRLYDADGEEPIWTGAGKAEEEERVLSGIIPPSQGYPRGGGTTAEARDKKLHPMVEPAIVGGIVSGLALIFFSNRSVGD